MSDAAAKPTQARRIRRAWYNPLAIARGLGFRPKLYLAVAAALAVMYAVPGWLPLSARGVIAWNTGAVVYLLLAFNLMSTCGTDEIRRRSVREDETRFVFFTLILLAVASSFAAVVDLIGVARSAADGVKPLYFSLAGIAIFVSWLVMQVVYTLHYAHEYYLPQDDGETASGGLKFPEDERPDYWDFFYFTTSIGATSQTSDVSITSKSLRRMVAFQAIVSFVFNTTVVALAINLAAGLL